MPAFATVFPPGLAYNRLIDGKTEVTHGSHICRHCIFSQRDLGLSAFTVYGPSCRDSAAAGPLFAGRAGRRSLCGGCGFAGACLSGVSGGEDSGGRFAGTDRLWRRSVSFSLDCAVYGPFLRTCGLYSGVEPAGRQPPLGSRRCVFYKCGRERTSAGGHGGLFVFFRCVSCRRQT